jgi:DNA-binding LacI/PurR family transcriptional regulator
MSEYTDPALTTVTTDKVELGARAVMELISLIEGDRSVRRHLVLPVELIVRDSTCPPSAAAGRGRR